MQSKAGGIAASLERRTGSRDFLLFRQDHEGGKGTTRALAHPITKPDERGQSSTSQTRTGTDRQGTILVLKVHDLLDHAPILQLWENVAERFGEAKE